MSLRIIPLILVSFGLFLITGCDRTRMDKGYEYFPDMAHSQAYQTYSDNPAMEDGKTMREPVAGTVPRHMIPYPYSADFEGREMAAVNLRNQHLITETLLEKGESLYQVFCANCHGIHGDGMGNLFTSGAYVIRPSSLIDEEAKSWSQGEIYHVISTGWGVMGAHASLIRPDDRWKIVAYVEEVLQAK